jgi:MFS family permease
LVIVTLAAVLALSSADTSTVGAAASELRKSLHIDNTDIGLLVSVSAAVGAIASIPFGILVDRVKRTTLLSVTIATWGVAMIASALVSSFSDLLLVRVFLGFVTAVAGPAVASLVGDYFPGQERGTIYGYILTGELVGGGVGFFITGDIAAISWRAAFILLAVPAFVITWQLRKLTEPARAARSPSIGSADSSELSAGEALGERPLISDVQQMARDSGVMADSALILRGDPRRMGILTAARYVLKVRTNVVLIVSSACAYFFLTGVQTFGLEFVGQQYGVGTVVATLMMLAIGAGAVLGVLVGGRAGDAMVKRGRIDGRMLVAGVAAIGTVVLFIPPLLTRSAVTALPYIAAAAFFLTAQNPTLDAARLDIMPPLLWGRAEGIRTLLRSAAQSVAPLAFGGLADLLASTHQGFRYTFLVMLLPLTASGIILLRGLRFYPADVATAAASATHEH